MSTSSYPQSTVGHNRSRLTRTAVFPALFLMVVLIGLWLAKNRTQPSSEQPPPRQRSPQTQVVNTVTEQLPPPPHQAAQTAAADPSGDLELTMPAAYAEPADRAALSGDQHLNDGDWRNQYRAAPPQQPPVARASLTEIRPYQDWDVHQTAADSLGRIGTAAVPALVRALSDADPKRRAEAAWLLGRIGPGAKQAVPALVNALSDPLPSVQKAASRALGQIGPDAAEAVEALMQLVEETEPIGVTTDDDTAPDAGK